MKCPVNNTFTLCIPFHLLQCRCHTSTNLHQAAWSSTHVNTWLIFLGWYDPLHIIMWPYWFIDIDLTCSSPLPSFIDVKSYSRFTATRSIASKPLTCPSRLQPVRQAKSCLGLLHLSHMTPCHDSYATSSHMWALQQIQAIFTVMAWVAHTHVPLD